MVTRALASTLPDAVHIVATDLNQAMLGQALKAGTSRPVELRRADAMQLPFADASFDAVVCQFGVMCFPDKAKAFAEVHRVLRVGGVFVFSAWDRITDNEFAHTVNAAIEGLFRDGGTSFMERTPHGYHDRAVITRDLEAGGFIAPAQIDTVVERSRAASARVPAVAYCQGTPLRNEIALRGDKRLDEATDAAEAALVQRFGGGAIEGKIQATVVTTVR